MAVPRVNEAPGQSSPYILPSHTGETVSIPGTKSVVRFLASAKETDGLLSVFHMDGILGEPVGFHFHNEAHDIFMCTQGQIKLWAADRCKILNPGDFASVPPGVVHSPQLVGAYNETIGLVTPGQWVDFFRFVSDSYDGILVPQFDNQNTMATMIPKFQEIRQKYDVIFQPEFQGADVSDWTEHDTVLPEGVETYYLRANTGPRYLLGGVLARPFITTKQSAGKFAIASIESSDHLGNNTLAKPFAFTKVHQVYCVLDGSIRITLKGEVSEVKAGETIFIPAGTEIKLEFAEKYVRMWSYSSGDALEALIAQSGGAFDGIVIPDEARAVDHDAVRKAAEAINCKIQL